MWFSTLLLLASVSFAFAQSPFPIVPAGTAINGSYDGHYRPRAHFSAPKGFINDPNGMFLDAEGIYHLYFQYNPTGTIAGNVHWGHATSRDLYHWENQPIALAPRNSTEGIFSGSAVVDVNNTSGFFPNQTNGVVAYYTINGPDEQVQAAAFSHDGGYTFEPYEGNPLIAVGSNSFRDPKVLWYEDHWVMVVSHTVDFTLSIYTSKNMVDWSWASNFSHHGFLAYQWECPNLVEVPVEGSSETMWLMYISVQPGAPQGGSIGQYAPGHFNGTHFTAVDDVARLADWGKDNYATQFFYGIPGNQNQISIAWASNWQYTNYVPTGPLEGWQSAMSLPRVNYLRNATRIGYVLVSEPYQINTVRSGQPIASNSSLGNGTFVADFSGGSGAIMLDVNMTNLNTTGLSNTASVNFTILSSTSGESLSGGQVMTGDVSTWTNRGNTYGLDNIYFSNKFSVANVLEDHFDLQVVFDRSILEIFTLRGEKSATLTVFPESLLDIVLVKTSGLNADVVVSVAVYELEDTWAFSANSNGIVPANTTSAVKRSLFGNSALLW